MIEKSMQEEPEYFKDRNHFRRWLKKYHNSVNELWILFYKVHTTTPCMRYAEAVEEALCFGWIDGKLKRVDNEKHIQRFSPRKPKSTWSKINKERALKMIELGKMTAAGKIKIEEAKKSGWWENAYSTSKRDNKMHPVFDKLLNQNPGAKIFYESLTQSQQNVYRLWINLAKRQETKLKRINHCIDLLKAKKKPGYFE